MSEPSGLIEGTHELVIVEGPGASPFLQGLISQDVETLDTENARRSFLLGPQGKLRALLWVFGSSGRYGLITDRGRGVVVAADLNHYRIRVKATVADPIPVSQVLGREADGAGGVSAPLGAVARRFVWGDLPPIARLPEETWTALRIEAGEPLMGVDVDEKTIPQESGLVDQAVSFTKGCYLGQELVARIDTRGHVNRRLRRVHLDHRVDVPVEIEAEGSVVGTLTSLAPAPGGNGFDGLAMVRANLASGMTTRAGGATVSVR